MTRSSEFTVPEDFQYNQQSTGRWIISHVWRYKYYLLTAMGCLIMAWIVFAYARVLIGQAVEVLLAPDGVSGLLRISLAITALLVADGVLMLGAGYCLETIATRFEADARQELYASLLAKSQAFHDRQRVGDIMSRATDDTSQLSHMVAPGSMLLFEAALGIIVPLSFMAGLRLELLAVPLAFVVGYLITVRRYLRKLAPVMQQQRQELGNLNAALEEALSGIEVVKASARELFERAKFRRNARRFHDRFVEQGGIEARYLPLLLYGIAVGLTFLHALLLYRWGRIGLAEVIGVTWLMNVLRFPTFISLFAISLVQSGIAGAERILAIIKAETDLDENRQGYSQPMQGAISFKQVSFGYGEQQVLQEVSFEVKPGQTVAIVGQTGSGKSALVQLVNRTYDASAGQVLIDGVDVRDWNLDALRSQISKIEQDIFLFSRSIGENIAFGAPQATSEQIEAAARAAQAHDFIMSFPAGYATVIGERGVTLSGGQRQRIALARAFLSNPRILILDDSTSAIDSATEDEIQRAIRQAQQGRTMLLITHRLAQIRWADQILVLDQGRLVGRGSHAELLRGSAHYRRIFARYDLNLPPLEAEANPQESRLAQTQR